MKIELSARNGSVYLTEEESVALGFAHPWPEGAAQTLAIVFYRVAKAAAAGEAVDITFPTGVVETINAPEPEPEPEPEDEDEPDGLVVFQMYEDQGSVVLFDCYDAEQRLVRIAVDHRLAEEIREVLHEDGEVPVIVEPWQIVARF